MLTPRVRTVAQGRHSAPALPDLHAEEGVIQN